MNNNFRSTWPLEMRLGHLGDVITRVGQVISVGNQRLVRVSQNENSTSIETGHFVVLLLEQSVGLLDDGASAFRRHHFSVESCADGIGVNYENLEMLYWLEPFL
jgi:hypothetical protein